MKIRRNKLPDAFKGKGFYLVLVLCLTAVGTAGYLSIRNVISTPSMDDWNNAANQTTSIPDTRSDIPVVKPQDNIKDNSKAVSATSSKSVSSASDIKKVKYQMPMAGNIVVDFSNSVPVFSKTMNDWRTHNGVDIAAKVGDTVFACADGTIEDLYTDELTGVTIVIAHADGVRSIYCGLQEKPSIKKDDTVKAGQAIAKVGETATFEILDAPHLHFQMIKSGIFLDPVEMTKN